MLIRTISWIFPGGFLLAAAGALVLLAPDPALLQEVTTGYPWVAYGGAAVLALVFQRSRVMAAAVLVVIVDQGFGAVAPERAGPLIDATAFYLPLTLALLSVLSDRGVLTPAGALQMGLVLVLTPGLAYLTSTASEPGAGALHSTFLPSWLLGWTDLGDATSLGFIGAFGLTLGMAVHRQGAVEKGLWWSIPALALAFHADPASPVSTLFLMTVGLILGTSVLETSYAMAYQDDLTGLPARRALTRDLDGLGSVFAVAMVDVDHFKRFNDRHGHDVGDQVLRMVATRLAKVQGGGKAYRYGGEEFTLLFPGKSRDEVLFYLEEVREAVADAVFTVRGKGRPKEKPEGPTTKKDSGAVTKRLSVTVSLGVADSMGKDPSPEAVLKNADKALYRAKKGGRNRVSK